MIITSRLRGQFPDGHGIAAQLFRLSDREMRRRTTDAAEAQNL